MISIIISKILIRKYVSRSTLTVKIELKNQYTDVPDRIITMALESVDFSKDRAGQILNTIQDDYKIKPKTVATNSKAST